MQTIRATLSFIFTFDSTDIFLLDEFLSEEKKDNR